MFCYEPKDEMIVQSYIKRLKSEENTSYRIIERDLYELLLQLLEDKRILDKIPDMEEKKGGPYLLEKLQNIARSCGHTRYWTVCSPSLRTYRWCFFIPGLSTATASASLENFWTETITEHLI